MNKILKVTVDSKVFISMLLGSRNCLKVYKAFASGILDIVISDELFEEISSVLRRDSFSKIVTAQDLKELQELLKTDAEWVILKHPVAVCRDPKDNMILEIASEGKADFIITGDQDLLELKQFRRILILSPKEFLKHLP